MKAHLKWFLPLFVLMMIAPFTPEWDLKISHFFYTPGLSGEKGCFIENAFTHLMFKYGEKLGFFCGGCVFFAYILSFLIPKLKSIRKGALTIGLTLALGSGLLVNGLFKEYWGRPRPKQIVEFGGRHLFRPFYHPQFFGKKEPQKSFPSGHATMGFFYLSFCLVGKRYQNRKWYLFGLFMTFFMGIGLSITRIIQGGHFFSDVFCAGILMWLVALFVDWLVFKKLRIPYFL